MSRILSLASAALLLSAATLSAQTPEEANIQLVRDSLPTEAAA